MTRARVAVARATAVAAAVAAGTAITVLAPPDLAVDAPFVSEGVVGATVSLDYADVTVRQVRAADSIVAFGDVAAAAGTFLVVDVTARPTRETTQFLGVEVVDGEGRLYEPADRAECSSSSDAPAGVDLDAVYCFDLPKDALEGARFRIGRGVAHSDHSGQRRDAVALVDLGLDPATAGRLWDAEDVLELQYGEGASTVLVPSGPATPVPLPVDLGGTDDEEAGS
ncbi:DUF4352 domain-containing protein [Antribacter sp. KLBMP9083]|uniref:DUF4352 domain-containing protein n=1 Tax=Antribacter soli TaxID=2910976 RepID=A0AA41QI93_9MICO|nr:DUF4352 domain-containing protein [Antribacter soli]MCF4122667.1 DUF4352 domain-containing protein [Antribacter soli]